MRLRPLHVLPAVVLVLAGILLGLRLEAHLTQEDTYLQLKKLEEAFLLINRRYVEDVDAEDLADHAIEAMLKDLDPHSSYITAEEAREMQETYRGSFSGVGIMFEIVDDTVRVVSPLSGGPSEEEGVMSGDQIVAIDDSSAIGIDNDEVRERLKGPKGSEVSMTVQRAGVPEPIRFVVTRDDIPLYTVDASYLMDDGETGYVRISRFAQTTHEEFLEAVAELRAQGMTQLMLDLRGNPGGVMDAAVRIVDELLAGRQTIVYTQGRDDTFNATYRSKPGDTLEDLPAMVLVSPYSASASEIVSGALQDHDRALIVGQRTFGKGLVQRPFQLEDGSLLQMTVSRYYTPSGRLIQTPYENGDTEDYYREKFEGLEATAFDVSEYRESVPDSLHFQTAHGRTVFGGGGILPDYFIPIDTTHVPLVRKARAGGLQVLMRDYFLRNEAQYRQQYTDERGFVNHFAFSDQEMNAFWTFAETEGGVELVHDSVLVNVEEDIFLAGDYEANEAFFKSYLKAAFARQLFGIDAAIAVRNEVDTTLEEAMQLWPRADRLAAYHAAEVQPQH